MRRLINPLDVNTLVTEEDTKYFDNEQGQVFVSICELDSAFLLFNKQI